MVGKCLPPNDFDNYQAFTNKSIGSLIFSVLLVYYYLEIPITFPFIFYLVCHSNQVDVGNCFYSKIIISLAPESKVYEFKNSFTFPMYFQIKNDFLNIFKTSSFPENSSDLVLFLSFFVSACRLCCCFFC